MARSPRTSLGENLDACVDGNEWSAMRGRWLLLLVVAGCSPYDDVALIDFTAVTPERIEPGATLTLHGHGFPLGRVPSVEFDGSLSAPGAPPFKKRFTVIGEVRSESRVDVPIDSTFLAQLGRRATFDGRVTIAFRAVASKRRIFATRDVLIDFLPETSVQLRAQVEGEVAPHLDERAFGVRLSTEDSDLPGVRVVDVRPDTFASRQGVRAKDVLIRLDGVRLYSRRDFVPDPSRTESTVHLRRAGLPGLHALRWPHAATEPNAPPFDLALSLLVGVLLGWFSPARLPWHGAPPTPIRARLVEISLLAILALAARFIPFMQWTPLWIAGLAVLATGAAYVGLARRAAAGFTYGLVAIAIATWVARGSNLADIVESQGPLPIAWSAFRVPAATAALVLYLHGLGKVSDGSRPIMAIYGTAGAILGAVLFLGGWASVPPFGPVFLAIKGWVVLMLSRALRIEEQPARAVALFALGLAAFTDRLDGIGIAPLWGWLVVGFLVGLSLDAILPARTSEPVPAEG